jgi:hypothetical protein
LFDGRLLPLPTHQVIKIAVQDVHSQRTHFKIRKSTVLRKVFKAYAQKQGIAFETMRFSFDGEVVPADQTAGAIGLEDGDIIDANVAQVGGGSVA